VATQEVRLGSDFAAELILSGLPRHSRCALVPRNDELIDNSLMNFTIREATQNDLADVRALMRNYNALLESFGVNLCFQNFEDELAALPGSYVRPRGNLWTARDEVNAPLGIIAVKPLDEIGVCEMKRLWVEDVAKGSGLGRSLANTSIAFARAADYRTMKLDTLRNRMPNAIALYRSLGFIETEAYVHNPEPDVLYMKLDLS
jgi:putative acetyltransferase